jgi:hypothetical protein
MLSFKNWKEILLQEHKITFLLKGVLKDLWAKRYNFYDTRRIKNKNIVIVNLLVSVNK